MKNSFTHQDITPTMSSIAFSLNPKEMTTICANVPTTLLYLRTATLLWNRILFIEWFLKSLIDCYLMFNVILLKHFYSDIYCIVFVASASIHVIMCVCNVLLKDLLTYLLTSLKLCLVSEAIQGGPAKVKQTYIFAGSIWYLNV